MEKQTSGFKLVLSKPPACHCRDARVYGHTTRPVALRAVVATGASGYIETRHESDTWKCGSLSFIFDPSAEGFKKQTNKTNKQTTTIHEISTTPTIGISNKMSGGI